MRLEEVALALYAVPPGEFVAARDEHVRQARAAGDKELAGQLRALRRPSQSAWLVNQLWRQRRELVDDLLAVGAEFRDRELTRQRMTELVAARRELLHQLVTEAAALAGAAGVRLTDDKAAEVEATMAAAMADEDAAAQLRTGRLTTALSYSGFGPQLQLVPDPPDRRSTDPDTDAGTGADTDSGTGAAGRPAAADGPRAAGGPRREGHRRTATDEASRRRLAEARAAVRSAERTVADRTRIRDKAAERRDKLARRRDELATELELVRSRLAVVDGELETAEQALRERTAAVDDAARDLAAARSQVDDLG